jgi:hypothetical protein
VSIHAADHAQAQLLAILERMALGLARTMMGLQRLAD